MNLDPFSSAIYHNTLFFNLIFVLILFVACLEPLAAPVGKCKGLKKNLYCALVYQYLIIPLLALVFSLLLQTTLAESMVLFLLASFPNNRFSLIVAWLARGSAFFAAVLGVLSVIFTLTLMPIVFYVLMLLHPNTRDFIELYTYWGFIELVFRSRMELLGIIVVSVLFAWLIGQKMPMLYAVLKTGTLYLAIVFVTSFAYITFLQSPEFFSQHWQYFSWLVLLFNILVLLGAILWVWFQGIEQRLARPIIISSTQIYIPACLVILYNWYPHLQQTAWILTVQIPIFHLLIVLLALGFRLKDKWYAAPSL